ncbi:hypothetical protein [Wenjunlia tyrosinilytica]|nr:hypothetical protein [Wenjunlia tyrosinilytica]
MTFPTNAVRSLGHVVAMAARRCPRCKQGMKWEKGWWVCPSGHRMM